MMTDLDEYEDNQEPLGPYEAYRNHLATCPRRHFGILADCSEAARLHTATATAPAGPAGGGR
uniref:hypothetical protein n=1 Tax=Streptomyces sp. NRRL B-1347 TaxID=1476877 RepID=UPI00055AB0EE